MFDNDLGLADDATVVAAIERWASAEAAAAARRLAAVAELARRRCHDDDRAGWACDSWDAAAAEVSAALSISHGRASGQMRLGLALARRLPEVAGMFHAGLLSYRIVSAIAWRTELVQDAEALAAIDTAIAAHSRAWGPLSDHKLQQAIDTWIDQIDPGALRRTRAAARSREVQIGGRDAESGTSSMWGRLFSTDAAILDRRLTQMARGVCDADPRTADQLRADALGALAAGSEALACRCGSSGCGGTAKPGSAAGIVIHIVAQAAGLQGDQDPHLSGQPQSKPYVRGSSLRDYLAGDPEPEAVCPQSTAVIVGGGVIPGPLLAELIRSGAKVRHLRRPSDDAEPQYRPSTALDEFVRMRDMTCRFPNCDRPAEVCDVDHALPWPAGPTHASNLRLLCRKHHLMKTFWAGERGWTDEQSPDGSIRWTSPTGRVYVTVPGSRLFFPGWNTVTSPVPPRLVSETVEHSAESGLQMPRRRRTRLAATACRIRRERALNDAHVAERNKPPPF
ncbi:MAG: DUF222 domain-containing protein [Mycolicibacterium sp.]|nr:DUF222 domain-containing protein [Mycolicibacterium sp.]